MEQLHRNRAGTPENLGTLALWGSSEHAQWYSCGRCSASLFYALGSDLTQAQVAARLLGGEDNDNGAGLERCLSWDMTRGGWREEMVDKMRKGVEGWAAATRS